MVNNLQAQSLIDEKWEEIQKIAAELFSQEESILGAANVHLGITMQLRTTKDNTVSTSTKQVMYPLRPSLDDCKW